MGCPLARTVKNYIDLDDSPAQSARDGAHAFDAHLGLTAVGCPESGLVRQLERDAMVRENKLHRSVEETVLNDVTPIVHE